MNTNKQNPETETAKEKEAVKKISQTKYETLLFLAYEIQFNISQIDRKIFDDDSNLFSANCLTHSLISTLEH